MRTCRDSGRCRGLPQRKEGFSPLHLAHHTHPGKPRILPTEERTTGVASASNASVFATWHSDRQINGPHGTIYTNRSQGHSVTVQNFFFALQGLVGILSACHK